MEQNPDYNRCVSFIRCQFSQPPETKSSSEKQCVKPVITITRQTGSGGHLLANKLAEYLQKRIPVKCSWAVFDQNLVEKVLEEHNLPKEIANYMPEDKRSLINDMVEELLGLHPPTWTLVEQTARTILHLAQAGNVIIVGRAANVITNKLPNTFHVKLVGSFETRVSRIMKMGNMKQKEAEHYVKKEDEARVNYVKYYFNKDPNDPLLYHMIINTDLIPPEEGAIIVGETVIRHFNLIPEQPKAEQILTPVLP